MQNKVKIFEEKIMWGKEKFFCYVANIATQKKIVAGAQKQVG